MPLLVALYPRIEVPVRILYAEGDQLLKPHLHGQTTAQQLPDAEVEIVPGGHMLPFTQPEMTARWVRRSLQSETRAAPAKRERETVEAAE